MKAFLAGLIFAEIFFRLGFVIGMAIIALGAVTMVGVGARRGRAHGKR